MGAHLVVPLNFDESRKAGDDKYLPLVAFLGTHPITNLWRIHAGNSTAHEKARRERAGAAFVSRMRRPEFIDNLE
jgi:hypothetical protein